MGDGRSTWGTVVAAAVLALLMSGCAKGNADNRYLGALRDRGVAIQPLPTGPVTGASAQMGHTVCDRLADGQPADLVVGEVAHIRLSDDTRFSVSEAQSIVATAIAELCPQHSPQPPAAAVLS